MSLKGEPAEPKTEKVTLNVLTKFIKPFNGDRETLPAFLTNCDNAMSLAASDQQPILCKYILSQLEGKAQIACSLKTFDTWSNLKEFLKTNFGEKKHSSHLLIDLQNCRQLPLESVVQYSLRIDACLTRILADIHFSCNEKNELPGRVAAMEDLALNTFLMGLNPNISSIVRCRNPTNLNDATTCAIEEEKLCKLTQITQRSSKSYVYNEYGPSPSDSFKNRPLIHKSYGAQNIPNPAFPNQPINNTKQCYYCKSIGHTIRDCRKREYYNQRRNFELTAAQPAHGNSSRAPNNSMRVHYCDDSTNNYVMCENNQQQIDLNE